MTYKIKEMSWSEFDKRRKETDTVIIPSGAIEVYGRHLPVGSDCIAAEGIATMIAERTGALIAPTIEMSDSDSLAGFPGTFSVRKEIFEEYMNALFLNLIHYGFQKYLFITGHAGSVGPINTLAFRYQKEFGITCAQVDWWRFVAVNGDGIFEHKGRMAHGHASESGTSVLLYFRPDLVHMDQATKVDPVARFYEPSDIIQYFPLEQKTDTGTVGDATIGSVEKGRLIVERSVEKIVSFMQTKFDAPKTIKEETEV